MFKHIKSKLRGMLGVPGSSYNELDPLAEEVEATMMEYLRKSVDKYDLTHNVQVNSDNFTQGTLTCTSLFSFTICAIRFLSVERLASQLSGSALGCQLMGPGLFPAPNSLNCC